MTVTEAAAAKIVNAEAVEQAIAMPPAGDSRRIKSVQERQFIKGAIF